MDTSKKQEASEPTSSEPVRNLARSVLLDSNSSTNEMARMKLLNIRALEDYHLFHLKLKMPPLKSAKRVRPTTASGVLQSHEISSILDDIRPFTAPDKGPLGLDPTYITSRHHVPGVPVTSNYKGRQVHGGIPEDNLKIEHGRRATIAGFEEVEHHEQPKRPSTSVGLAQQLKVTFILTTTNFVPANDINTFDLVKS